MRQNGDLFMKKHILKLISLAACTAVVLGSFCLRSSAASLSSLSSKINQLEQESKKIESQINSLQSQKNNQQALKSAIESKIANTQAQINLCNSEISKINAKIAANKAEIAENNKKIEEDKLTFKKRLRAIYMSNSGSQVQVLMGAEDFSDFLQLSQLTSSVSSHDKAMIEKLVGVIKELEAKQEENNKLLEDQVSIKNTIAAKQSELESESNKIQNVINSIASDQSGLKADNKAIEAQKAEYQRQYNEKLKEMQTDSGYKVVYDGGAFLWPVQGYYGISAGYASNDAVHNGRHYGIDIAGGGIQGKPVIAIADGVVYKSNNSCKHNYKKNGSCGCGGGYGNYVAVDHGTGADGKNYKAYYAHMSSITVGTGTAVKKGQVIGYVGTTGWSTGFHLHLGIMVNNNWVNPMNFYKRVK